MATILGIESTCDETAASVVDDGYVVRSNVVASQAELHAKYRGVVPEIASRAHIENILPVIREALATAGASFNEIDAIAVAHRPGLIGSLLIGVTAAKTLAWSLGNPLIGIDHVHAHLYSVALETNLQPPMPAVGLVCSGGHTALYAISDWLDVRLIGSTIDDAVGEAYDKVAAILGLGYPGGPILDRLAAQGDPKAIEFPRTLLERESLDFSFSGLKTAVLYHVRGVPRRGEQVKQEPNPPMSQEELSNIASGFQAACIDVIIEKLRRAARQTGARSVIIGGGVSANRGLRARLSDFELPVFFPRLQYCTDNAAMTAGLAHVYFARREFSELNLDAITYSQFREER
jgi:N6-L-threonylcarbamoyladenine synthase